MNHFNDIELRRWAASGPGEEGARLIAHLAACAVCASRYAVAIRQCPLQAEPATDVESYAAVGRRIVRRRSGALTLAAAAALVVLIGVPWMRKLQRTPELHLRGATVITYSTDRELAWSSGLSAAKYRIEVGEGAAVVYSAEVDRSPIDIPQQLRPGKEYWWTVTALDAQGLPLVTSPRRTLTIQK